ncbi:MFS transporter [Phenylobacterium sp.]|uniref:MFS transporter n=1 Tax=Phenylobacterium sp. TaxID=1871053 RepID=UPI00374CC780
MIRAPHPPIWLLGFGLWPLGVNGALLLITMPQLLAAQHLPATRIAAITAMALAPGFVSFLLAPLLDWRWSRRTWAILFTLVTSLGSVMALAFVRRPEILPVFFFLSNLGAYLVAAACGGWFGELVARDRQGALGSWFAAVNIASGGLVAALAIPIFRGLPEPLGALTLGGLNLLALPLLLMTPCPAADARLAREGVAAFAKDVARVVRRPIVLWTLLLFVSPATAFALTNSLSGYAAAFHTPEATAGLLGGAGVCVAGIVGSLIAPRLGAGLPPRVLYIVLGLLGASFSLLLIWLPRTPALFGVALLGENIFQAAAFAISNLISLNALGEDNPLAATQFGLLFASSAIPLTYMQIIDGAAFSAHGLNGGLFADAALTAVASVVLALILWGFRASVARAEAANR